MKLLDKVRFYASEDLCAMLLNRNVITPEECGLELADSIDDTKVLLSYFTSTNQWIRRFVNRMDYQPIRVESNINAFARRLKEEYDDVILFVTASDYLIEPTVNPDVPFEVFSIPEGLNSFAVINHDIHNIVRYWRDVPDQYSYEGG